MQIAIVTDSTADLSLEQTNHHKISIIPAVLVMEGKEYLDGEGMSREDYYSRVPNLNPPPSTAAPASGMFTDLYRKLFKQGYDHIVSIHAASTLSGIFNAACLAGDAFSDQVTVIDSGQLSLGLGFQAIAAASAAVAEKTVQSVIQAVTEVHQRIRVIAMLDTLDQLKRSGRASWLQAGMGSLLQIKMFIELKDGKVSRLGEARTRTKGIARMIEMLERFGPLEQLAVLHTNAEEDAKKIANQLAAVLPHPPLICNVTTVIGTHVGVNALGFAAVLKP